jgi:hypothetical protein
MPSLYRPSLLVLLFIGLINYGCGNGKSSKSDLAAEDSTTIDSIKTAMIQNTAVNDLTQEIIEQYSRTNACYLPLLIDSTLHLDSTKLSFKFEDLFNEKLPSDHPYRNRYLVGDFNVLDKDYKNRGVQEINPMLELMIDFKEIEDTILKAMEHAIHDEDYRDTLKSLVQAKHPDRADELNNFFNKVWKYKTPPIVRKYGVAGSNVYAAGQTLCMCEAKEDTLMMVGRFAISGKRQSPSVRITEDGREIRSMHESHPIGKRRSYYAGRYLISSKNWESQRRYEPLDIAHDDKLGGGNNQVTYYQGRAQLPNFLLMKPAPEYPDAMTSNGIHEVALAELSRGMLGSPNSIGCIRVTDFGSKFLRWWTPQNCNFFILYSNDRYLKKLDTVDVETIYPFKTKEEGDKFRRWVNETMPDKAKALDIDPEGDHKNGFVIDAYTIYRKEYEQYLQNNR